jgi:L-iditol 2-dehydrogenase
MKSFELTGIRQMKMITVPDPKIERDTDVLIRMKTVGVCGSDVHYYTTGKIGNQVVEYPFPVGHESAGIVEKVGAGVTRVKEGDRIAIEPAMPCHECDQCLCGRYNTCRNLKFLGCPGQAPGCLSEFIVMPESSCFPIPDNMSFDEATISEPLAIGVYAVKQANIKTDDKVGILGYGPIGMSVHLAAKASGISEAMITDKISERLKIAERTGAIYAGNPVKNNIEQEILNIDPSGLDCIFECCGQQDAFYSAFHLLKPGGKIVIIGIPDFEYWNIPVDLGRRKEISIIHIRRQNESLEETLKGIANKKYDVSMMPTHHFDFSETMKAFEMVSHYQDGVMKAMIEFK